MPILVIGGNGFFGRKLVIRLLSDEAVSSVISMDVATPSERFIRFAAEFGDKFHSVRGDVSQLEDILSVMKSFSVQKVVNFAYLMSRETENMPRLTAKINVLGMCNVFEAARLLGVSRVVYPSSVVVYGLQSEYGDREVTEDDTPHPSTAYGITKQLNELMAAKYSARYNMSIIGLRPGFGFGHGRRAAGVSQRFSDIVSLPATGKPVHIQVKPSRSYTLICSEDIAEFTRILLHAKSPKCNMYNMAGPATNLAQIANQVREYIPDAKIEFGYESGDFGQPSPTRISMVKSKEEFGFSLTPLGKIVLTHINEARAEVGLNSI